LLIQPPQSILEAARMSTTEADAAVLRGDHQQALAAYQRALSADPSNGRTKTMIAFMYLRLNRYQEAIRPLEDVLAGAVGERNLSFVLALAYVGAGDEGDAVRVLRWTAGLPEDQVRTEVGNARERSAPPRPSPLNPSRCELSLRRIPVADVVSRLENAADSLSQ
jgi:Flp pilus assembly protein TadD